MAAAAAAVVSSAAEEGPTGASAPATAAAAVPPLPSRAQTDVVHHNGSGKTPATGLTGHADYPATNPGWGGASPASGTRIDGNAGANGAIVLRYTDDPDAPVPPPPAEQTFDTKVEFTAVTVDTPFVVPAGVTQLKVLAAGPGGGSGRRQRADVHAGDGGAGAGVEGLIPVTPGETLTLVVGQGAPGGVGVADNNYGRGGFGAPYTAIKRGSTHLVIAAGGGGGGG